MKSLKHISTLSMVFVLSLLLVNCEKVDPNTEIDSSQLKSAQIFPNTTIDYLEEVISTLEEMVVDEILSYGNANALISKAENAIKSIEKGNTNAVNGQLSAFTAQVEEYVEEEILTPAEGQILLDLVNDGPQPVNTFTDPRDNKTYITVQIGDQVWMAENLAYLPEVSPSNSGSEIEPFYYVYDYQGTSVAGAKATNNYSTYGVLYNWTAVKASCPNGWHLPTVSEWEQLAEFISNENGGYSKDIYGNWSEVGNHLKSEYDWILEGNGTDDYGFKGSPGGYRNASDFVTIGEIGVWSSDYDIARIERTAPIRYMWYSTNSFHKSNDWRSFGMSVRCVKD